MQPDHKIKLLYVSVHDPHVPLTGTGARVGAFVNQLALRHHVDLVYLDGSGQPPSAKLSAHYANSVTGVASKTCIPYSQRGYFLFSPDLYRAAAERLKREHYDYIICDYGLAAVYGLLLSRRFRTPFIYSSHNIEYRANLGKARVDPRRLPLALYMYTAEKMAVKQARCVVAITPADADDYASRRRTRTTTRAGFLATRCSSFRRDSTSASSIRGTSRRAMRARRFCSAATSASR
jgi:hypothetical protein